MFLGSSLFPNKALFILTSPLLDSSRCLRRNQPKLFYYFIIYSPKLNKIIFVCVKRWRLFYCEYSRPGTSLGIKQHLRLYKAFYPWKTLLFPGYPMGEVKCLKNTKSLKMAILVSSYLLISAIFLLYSISRSYNSSQICPNLPELSMTLILSVYHSICKTVFHYITGELILFKLSLMCPLVTHFLYSYNEIDSVSCVWL